MKGGLSKRPRIGLEANSYRALHREILARDGWRCQQCGSLSELEVHHIWHRSQQGEDSDHNLVTLCVNCHRAIHG